MTNIAINGCNGKMGKVIYKSISERNDCVVCSGIDVNTEKYADFPIVDSAEKLESKPDVIIDYSHPSALDNLLEYCLSNKRSCYFSYNRI